MAVGAWFAKYRIFLYAITFTLLAVSFYRTYKGKGDVSPRNKKILWITAAMSISLTGYTIIKSW